MTVRRSVVAGLLAAGLCAAAWAGVSASVDRTQLGPGDSVQLTLQTDSASGDPDLAPLARDFDILGRSSSTSYQLVNGQASTTRQLILTLVPHHAGTVQVPALRWGGEQTHPIVLSVGGAPGQAGASTAPAVPASSAHVFLTSRVDPPEPYVQAGVALTVRLHSDEPLYQASLDLPEDADVLVRRVGKDRQSEETRDGRSYQVFERHYMLFPQRSGAITLPGPVLDAQVAAGQAQDPMFGRLFGQFGLPGMAGATRPIRVHGDPITLQVRPRPPGFDGKNWLPARQLTLAETWQPADDRAQAGQPLTRHLSLKALGLSAAQLPDLSQAMALPPGLKAYPDQPKLSNGEDAGSVVGQRDQDIAVIADRPGRYRLPALHLRWWDTSANVAREVVLPARTLDISPAAGASVTTPPAAASGEPGAAPVAAARPAAAPVVPATDRAVARWRALSVGLALAWAATACAWALTSWRRRSHRAPPAAQPLTQKAPAASSSAAAARKAWLQACRDDAPGRARDAALAWAAAVGPDRPAGLNALARRLGDPALTPLLRQLEQACLAGSVWDGQPLARALAALPAAAGAAPARGAVHTDAALPTLYADPPGARGR